MKAVIQTTYGSPDKLHIKEISKPAPKKREVLVRVKATAVNDYDWSMVRGEPKIYRLMFGILRPKTLLGMELAGIVEACGAGVENFKEGDEVFGDTSDHGFGSFAEFMCVHEDALVKKPIQLTFAQAAATPHASMLAIQALKDIAKIKQNQKILINGAGGGVGSFALQYAKLFGAIVTGVDSSDKLASMTALGFDQVISYQQDDFTKGQHSYDIILDAKTNRSAFRYLNCLKRQGVYVTVGGFLPKLLQVLLCGPVFRWLFKKNLRVLALKANKGLTEISDLLTSEQLKCPIEGPFSLEEAPKAIQYFGDAKHKGKVVISL